MESFKNVARNSSIIATSRVVNSLIGLFIIALVARYLDRDLFGKYIFATMFVMIFDVFTDMGYNIVLVREVTRAKDRVKEIVGVAVIVKLLVAFLSLVLIILVTYLFDLWVDLSPLVIKAIMIMALAIVIDFTVDIFLSVSRGFERMEYEALLTAFNMVTFLGLVAIVIHLNYGFLYLFLSRLISNAMASALAVVLFIRNYGVPHLRPFSHLGLYLSKEAFPLGIGQIMDRFYTRTNLLLIRIIKTVVEVGFYGGAYRIVEQLSMISNAIVTSVFPVLSRYSQDSKFMLNLAYEKTLKLLVILGFPMAVGISVLANRIAPVIFGKGLTEISGCLKVLALVLAFSFPNFLFKFVLSSINKQAIYRNNVLACFSVNLFLALALVPHFGYMGAAYTMVFSSFILFLLGFHTVSKNLIKVGLSDIFLKPAIASIIMGIFLGSLSNMPLFLVIPGGVVIYLATLVLLKTFSRDEIILLKEVMGYPIQRLPL